VIDGEKDPEKCWATNAVASESLLNIAAKSTCRPWVLVASSREVYGEQAVLPVKESVMKCPINIYGKAKAYMEDCSIKASDTGINTAIVRLANVYGCVNDHTTRVLPAFCRNAVLGEPLRVDGFNNLFDFTHIDDVVVGIAKIVEIINRGNKLPPIHLLPGIGVTLKEAAEMAVKFAESQSIIREAPARNFDVSRFIGCPNLSYELLGWKAQISPEEGIKRLVKAFKRSLKEGKLS
jgi:nucleoside-diphosphate-sugar epimerase